MSRINDLLQKNAVVVAAVVLIVLFSVWFVSSLGIPFIGDSPNTFDPQSVTTVNETSDAVVVRLSDAQKADRTTVVSGNKNYQWSEDNTVRIERDNLDDTITVESYAGGNLYKSYDYNIGEIQSQIVSETDSFLTGQTYSFEIVSSNSDEPSDVQWTIDGDKKNANSTEIVESFSEEGTHTLSVSSNISGRQIEVSRTINVTEPSDVDFDIIVNNSTNVLEFEEIEAETEVGSNTTIEEVTWNWGQNSQNETLPINETSLNWYTEPGTYTVKATGITKELGRQVSATESINVEERPVEQVTYEVSVQVFSGRTGKAVRQANISLGELVSKETGTRGVAEFEVIPGQYNIEAKKQGFKTEDSSINVKDNVLLEFVMNETSTEEKDNTTTDNNTEEVEEGVDAFDVNRNITSSNNLTQEQLDAEAPSGLEKILNKTPGNGTVDDPHLIRNIEELQAISSAPSQSFRLANDIDASNTRGWNPIGDIEDKQVGSASETEYELEYDSVVPSSVNLSVGGDSVPRNQYQALQNGTILINQSVESLVDNATPDSTVTASYTTDNVYRGFDPISSEGQTSIRLDGRGNTIRGLYINRDEDDVGMISELSSGIIENVNFEQAEVIGQDRTGILASSVKSSSIENILIAGTSTGGNEVGGLAGRSLGSNIEDVDSIGSVNGKNKVGMVIGSAGSSGGDNTVMKRVSAQTPDNRTVVGNQSVGGIVGQSLGVQISNSLSASNIVGQDNLGGIAGGSRSGTTIRKGYSASVIKSEGDNVGAIVGSLGGASITEFYWDTEVGSIDSSIGKGTGSPTVEGLTTSEMKGQRPKTTMSSLNFGEIWKVTDEYPVVSSQSGLFSVEVSVVESSNDEPIDGNFEVTLGEDTIQGPETTFEDVARGEYTITAEADGFVSDEKTRFISESTTVELALEPAKQFDVSLSAIGIDDDIITDAAIELDGEQKIQRNGPVEFTGIDEGTYNPEFEKSTHSNRQIELKLSGNEDSISKTVVMRQTKNISLTIVDRESGEEIETDINYTLSSPREGIQLKNVSENPNKFSNIAGLDKGEFYDITVNAGGYNSKSISLNQSEVTNSTSKTIQLNRSNSRNILEIRPENIASGDLATPVNVEVTQLGSEKVINKSTKVGSTEPVRFTLKNTTRNGVGNITAEITSPSYEKKKVTEIPLEDNKDKTIFVRKKQDRSISVAQNADDTRIENAYVRLQSTNQEDRSYDNVTRTGSEGQVTFPDVINGEYEITINAKGFDRISKTITLETGDNPSFTLDEQPTTVIELSVDDSGSVDKFELESPTPATDATPGASNPQVDIQEGVRYRFEGSAISTYDIDILDNDGDAIVSQTSSASSVDKSGNLDVGYINNGNSFEFTAEDEFTGASEYKHRSNSNPTADISFSPS